jgi:hypothetical protein
MPFTRTHDETTTRRFSLRFGAFQRPGDVLLRGLQTSPSEEGRRRCS